jgi:SAM-dependent methyltransferase
MHPLPLTGERTLPGVPGENYWFARHLAAYEFAADRCELDRVVDAGCGEGYGTALLAGDAGLAVGVELVGEVAAHARQAYPECEFIQADICALPLSDASVDAMVSLQVIEHLPDLPRALAETARVLRPGGLVVATTPNRLTFTPHRDTPENPFHVTEFSPAELSELISRYFELEQLLGTRHRWWLRLVEAVIRRSLPARMAEQAVEQWPRWLSWIVAGVSSSDFRLDSTDLATSLDLLVLARKPE